MPKVSSSSNILSKDKSLFKYTKIYSYIYLLLHVQYGASGILFVYHGDNLDFSHTFC